MTKMTLRHGPRYRTFHVFLLLSLALSACAHHKAKEATSLSQLRGKRVALADVKGGPESKSHVEVALVNEIIDQGRFELIDRASVQEAMVSYPDRSDWKRLGESVKADYILAFKVSRFDVKEKEGYDRIEEEDPSLEAETGNAKTSRYTKVKGRQGTVALDGMVFDVADNRVSYEGSGSATASLRIGETDPNAPGKMQLLEKLTTRAIRDFFEKMPRD